MEENILSSINNQLTERRERLLSVIEEVPGNNDFQRLLNEVDAALDRIKNHAYGICEVCHDPVETERLLIDPLLTFCLDHLNAKQKRDLESDLEYAGKIQQALFPKKEFRTAEWEFAFNYIPASTVGGDFCNIIPLKDGSLFFILGDVSGKGVSASIMMSNLHALINTLLSFDLPLEEIMFKANRLFCESTLSTNYATMVAGKAIPDGTVELCIAGHNPPLVFKDGYIQSVSATSIPIGLFCNAEYTTKKFQLRKDEFFFLYTDGLSEAAVNGNEFGEIRIKENLQKLIGLETKEIVGDFLFQHRRFLNNAKPEDDVLVAAIKKIG